MNIYRLMTLVIVSTLVAILFASALGNYTRVSDSALADTVPTVGAQYIAPLQNAPTIPTAKRNYLPIIFLNAPTDGFWSLYGNAGTNPNLHFLGTMDNVTLTLRVSNTIAMRIAPAGGNAPNIIGGYSGNSVASGVIGAFIGGGGEMGFANTVGASATYAAIGGGTGNAVNGTRATIGGGSNNTATGSRATIGGGANNTVSGIRSVVGGGSDNTVTEDYSAIGGGTGNTITNTGNYATIGGGYYNTASNSGAIVGGGRVNVASGNYATLGGGDSNLASGNYATVAGGKSNTASGAGAFIGGGGFDGISTCGNEANGKASTLGGGYCNSTLIAGTYSTVGGGYFNTASGYAAIVPGGSSNNASGGESFAAGFNAKANHDGAFVWSDISSFDPFTSTGTNQFLIRASGGVGIGTNSPDTQLHVVKSINGNATPANHVALIENTANGSNADGLAIKIGYTSNPTVSNNFITFFRGGDVPVGAIEGNGSGGIQIVSGGADYAEYLPRANANELLEPGDIVGVFDGRITKSTRGATHFMVVSTSAIVAGNDPGETKRDKFALVAFIGQAKVRVRGIVRAGDFILPSGYEDGTGIAISPEIITPEQFEQVVGQAWEASNDTQVKFVNVAVGLARNDPTTARLVAQNQSLEARVDAVEQQSLPHNVILLGAMLLIGVIIGRRWRRE